MCDDLRNLWLIIGGVLGGPQGRGLRPSGMVGEEHRYQDVAAQEKLEQAGREADDEVDHVVAG